MRITIMTVGDIVIEDEPARKSGLIGGRIYARNTTTGEEIHKNYRTLHDGRTTKWSLAGELLKQMLPPEEENIEASDAEQE